MTNAMQKPHFVCSQLFMELTKSQVLHIFRFLNRVMDALSYWLAPTFLQRGFYVA